MESRTEFQRTPVSLNFSRIGEGELIEGLREGPASDAFFVHRGTLQGGIRIRVGSKIDSCKQICDSGLSVHAFLIQNCSASAVAFDQKHN